MKFRIFISSVQSEFVDERRRLTEYIRQDALLGIFKTIIWRNCPGTVEGYSHGTVRVQSGGIAVAPEMAPAVAPEHRLPKNTQGRIQQTVQNGEMSRQQLADALGVVRKARFLKMAIDELLSDGLLELSYPENPNDRRQAYRLTPKVLIS